CKRAEGESLMNMCAPFAMPIIVPISDSEVEINVGVDVGHSIGGHVIDDNGKGVSADIIARECGSGIAVSVVSGPDGTFVLGPLRSGRYDVMAVGPDGRASNEATIARAGEEGLVIRLQKFGRLEG